MDDEQDWKLETTVQPTRIETLLGINVEAVKKKASKESVAVNRRLIFMLLAGILGLSLKVIAG